MKPFATFDIETDPFKRHRYPLPFCCDFFDGNKHRVFWGADCVAKCFAVMRKFKGYIYAHNGGKFDFKYLLPLIDPNSSTVKVIKGRIAKIALNNVEFRDSYLMLPVPLAKYGKTPIDYKKLEANVRTFHRAEIIAYLKNDCENLYRMVDEFVGEYGFGLTLAGRTFAALKSRFNIEPPKTNGFYDTKMRKYYYGGRVEFFELGHLRGQFSIFDINSAYPAVMRSKHCFNTDFISVNVLPTNREILQTCFISLRGESFGGIPWRTEENGLSFKPTTGVFNLTGWELLAALDLKLLKIKSVLVCHRPLECRDFSAFVDYFYALKRKAAKGSSDELFAKLLLNSCYGRFALNPEHYRDVKLTNYGDEPDENTETRKKGDIPPWTLANDFPEVGISIWEKLVPPRQDSYFNVATAASITGAVRAFLMHSLVGVKRAVYCDTDCIICERGDGLKIGAELGEWKLEGVTVPDGLWIAGKKLYAAKLTTDKWKTAAKGVRLDPRDICRIAEGETLTTTLDAPTFSLLTGDSFCTRTIRRDDLRIRRAKRNKKIVMKILR